MKSKRERLIDCKRRQKLAETKMLRLEKTLDHYLSSPIVKKLKRDVEAATDKLNAIIDEWNDIVMEGAHLRGADASRSVEYTSVNGELRENYREDPKSW